MCPPGEENPIIKNGVDVTALTNTVNAVAEKPALGSFEFRASTEWKNGALVESTFTGHKQNGVDTTRKQPHKWGGDESPGLLGTGLYQSPTDSLLHAMSHCLTVTAAYHGAARGVTINKLNVAASGSLDLQGFLNLNEKKRPGFKHIHLQVSIDSPNAEEEVVGLFNYAQGRSPICQTVRNKVNFVFEYDVENDGSGAYTEDDEDRHGVSYKALTGTIEAFQKDPDLAKAKFYTDLEWGGGAVVATTFNKLELPEGNFQYRDEPLTVVADEPPALLGGDAGPGPSETVLHGVGNCASVAQSYFAAANGIRVNKFQIDFKGDIDLQGFMDLDDNVCPAYETIRAKITARAGGKSQEELLEFYKNVPNLSPILDTVRNPVHVTFGLTYNGKVVSGNTI